MGKMFTTGLAVLAVASAATAQVIEGPGDAGDLPATAQVTAGIGALTSISGTIGSATDADLYQIFITGGGTFSATTASTPGTTLGDPQLFLFNAAGIGVYANDDFGGSLQATLPAGNPLTPTAPGLYYLAITSFNRDPVSPGGVIFPVGTLVGPTGPGGGQPVSGYTGTGGTGTYAIRLTGAEFAVIPEPGTLTLLGAGALGLLACGRRRRKQAA
jgi:hypothetical protein